MCKVLLPLCCAAFGLCAGPKALWLVYPEPLKYGVDQERFLRTEFEVPKKEIKQAFVGYIIDDYGTVLLNGQNVANGPLPRTEIPSAKKYDITKLLVPGRNVIAVTAVNAGGPGGFILHISVTFQDDSEMELFTDTATWKVSKVKTDGWDKIGFVATDDWKTPDSPGDRTVHPWADRIDMLAIYANADAVVEVERRRVEAIKAAERKRQLEESLQKLNEQLATEQLEEVKITYKNNGPFFDIGGKLYRPVLYNGWFRDSQNSIDKINNFAAADMNLYAMGLGSSFWKGPDQYDFESVDKMLSNAMAIAPKGRFLIGLGFSHGPQWWNLLHPDETIKYGRKDDKYSSRDGIGPFLAPSYASELWLKEASEAVRKLVEHIENSPYGKHVFAYRIDAGVYAEWHYHGMGGSMPDISAPMTKLFRSYLRERYNDDVEQLRKAWRQPNVTFENAAPPPAEVRLQYIDGLLRDPVEHAWSIDFLHCIQRSLRTALLTMNKAAKDACNGRALVGNYCGYFFGMGYSAEGWHLVNDDFVRSPYVDFQVSPCCYSKFYRKIGSTMLARSLWSSYRLHNKICIFEADGRTHLAAKDANTHCETPEDSIAMLSRDLVQAISKGCAYWYYDFGRDWYNSPEIFQFFHKIAPVFDAVKDFSSSAETAVIADWESPYYYAVQTAYGGPGAYMNVNYVARELKGAGLQFDAYSFADIDNPVLQNYKVYIFPNLVYMTPEKLAKLNMLKKAGKTFLFMSVPGWLTPNGQDTESIFKTTGIRADVLHCKSTVTTTLTDGTVMDYFENPSEIGWKHAPVLKITDNKATLLGSVKLEDGTDVFDYATKKNADGTTVYVNGAPVMTSQELRKIAKNAGVHIYCDSNKGVVFANKSMISFHTGTPGEYTLKAKSPVKWTMVFPEKRVYPDARAELTFTAPQQNTYIFMIEP